MLKVNLGITTLHENGIKVLKITFNIFIIFSFIKMNFNVH